MDLPDPAAAALATHINVRMSAKQAEVAHLEMELSRVCDSALHECTYGREAVGEWRYMGIAIWGREGGEAGGGGLDGNESPCSC